MVTRDKIRGMMVGIGIGDALGMPIEGYPPDRIRSEHPAGLRSYISGEGHKHWHGTPPGTTTDDTALTKIVMQSILDAGCPDMDNQAKHHVLAYETIPGMGRTTRESLRRLSNNVPWSRSGESANASAGNGVPMKIAPVAAYMAVNPMAVSNQWLVDFASMTHNTKMAAVSGIVHAHVLYQCLRRSPMPGVRHYDATYDLCDIAMWMCDPKLSKEGQLNFYSVDHLKDLPDDYVSHLALLNYVNVEQWDSDRIWSEFGGTGSQCYYVYYSMPLCYAHFIRDPFSLETLFSTLNAGGDADTNASVVGGMLGALNGLSLFPEELRHGCKDYDELINLADQFCDQFGVAQDA